MTRLSLCLSTSLGLGALSLSGLACNSFDPNLGDSPFRCGTESPRCPDKYECVTYSATEEVCERAGTDPNDRADSGPDGPPDARSFTCNNDSEIEPNESLSDPTLTSIPTVQESIRLVGLAICPGTDQDFFRFDVNVNATDATIEVEYQADRGELKLDLLNDIGTSVGSAVPVGDNPNLLRVAIPNLPIGTYFGHVRSGQDGDQNNYSIEIVTTP